MHKHYIGVQIVGACPQKRNGVDGYNVCYKNQNREWVPKEEFENIYLPMGERNYEVTPEMIRAFHAQFGNSAYLSLAGKEITETVLSGLRFVVRWGLSGLRKQ